MLDIMDKDSFFKYKVKMVYITTSNSPIDYGGVNKYEVIKVGYDPIKDESYYVAPIVYEIEYKKEDYEALLKNVEEEANWELRKEITNNILKVMENYKWYAFKEKEHYLNVTINNIDLYNKYPENDFKYSEGLEIPPYIGIGEY